MEGKQTDQALSEIFALPTYAQPLHSLPSGICIGSEGHTYMSYTHISTKTTEDLQSASDLVVHQNPPLTLTVLQHSSRELLTQPPPRRETHSSCSSIWIQVRKTNGLGGGKVHIEAIMPFLAQLHHLRALRIIGLASRFSCVPELVICQAIIT
jgi:hypothetical protein